MKLRICLPIFFLVCSSFIVAAHKVYAADVRLSLHNDYATWPELSTSSPRTLGTEQQPTLKSTNTPTVSSISNRVWTMGGFALLSSKGDSVEKFLSYSEVQIRDQLKSYLKQHSALNPNTDDLIILDMEHPIHPKTLGEHSGARQAQIIEAFKMRIKVARQELPHAKLSLYGVIVPNASGDSSRTKDRTMIQGYTRAGQLGMFDDLDYLSPVLYLRFGPQEKGYNAMEAYMRQGIEASRAIKTSKGTPLPLAPMLNFKISNSNSKAKQQCIPVESIQKQLKIAQEYEYVHTVVLWSSKNTIVECSPQKTIQLLTSPNTSGKN